MSVILFSQLLECELSIGFFTPPQQKSKYLSAVDKTKPQNKSEVLHQALDNNNSFYASFLLF